MTAQRHEGGEKESLASVIPEALVNPADSASV